MYDQRFIHGKVYMEGALVETNVYLVGEQIAKITDDLLEAQETHDISGHYLLPGIIDPHVHFHLNVGDYVSADDFYTGSICGAYGGVTTFIDFLDPVSSGQALESAYYKRRQEAENSVTDYLLHGTVANPKGQVMEIVDQMKALGLRSLKLFTTYSDSDRRTYEPEIKSLLELTKSHNFMVLAHIEADDLITLKPHMPIKDLPISRPSACETIEALKMASWVRETGGYLYMVHLSSGNTLEALEKDFSDLLGSHMHIESCPQYFYLNQEVFKQDDGYRYLLAPPLRSAEESHKLLAHSQTIETIGTDHCPFMDEQKHKAWIQGTPMGIGGIEHAFSLMYTKLGLDAVRKMSEMPARLYGLYPQKGAIAEGTDADLLVYDPSSLMTIKDNHSSCDFNVYDGFTVAGQVVSTMVRGQWIVYKRNYIEGHKGRYLGD